MNRNKLNLILSMVIFGTIGLVRRGIPYPSGVIALVRAVVGLAFLCALGLLRHTKPDWKALRANAVPLVLSGVLLGFNWICLFEAYKYTAVSVATMCYYMAPVIVIVASPVIFRERLGLRQGLCAAVAVLGMLLVSGMADGDAAGSGTEPVRGVLFGLAAAVMYAAIIMLNKKIRGVSGNDRTVT